MITKEIIGDYHSFWVLEKALSVFRRYAKIDGKSLEEWEVYYKLQDETQKELKNIALSWDRDDSADTTKKRRICALVLFFRWITKAVQIAGDNLGKPEFETENERVNPFEFSSSGSTKNRPAADKQDYGKTRLSLVPPELIEAAGAVYTWGTVKKYPDFTTWRTLDTARYRDALMRHICAYLRDPGGLDEETGLPHLWHIAANVGFLCALENFTHNAQTGAKDA